MAMAKTPRAKAHFFQGGSFVLGAICSAVVGIPAGIIVAERANTKLVVQQEKLSELQTFENTGAQLDSGVTSLSDAIVDGRGADDARRNLRAAISAHSSAAFALRGGLGGDYQPYMTKLVELRGFADEATDAPSGVKVWQSTADLVAMRKRSSDRIRAEATK